MVTFDVFDGAILIDKPTGMTSHDVVEAVRRQFQFKKTGHCGTLDPNATGLLVLLLGRATKMSERFMSSDKVYEGAIKLGEATDSYDADGELVASLPVPVLSLEQLNSEACQFQGDLMQVPPMVSAKKQDGVPLYKLARRGVEVERKPRLIHIYKFHFLTYEPPIGTFIIACTKGTYVRSVAHELGQKIGCGAHLSALRRTKSGVFDLKDALPLDALLSLPSAELQKRVIPFMKLVELAGQ
jgi:tRNA pseudouridine55 synthase